MNISVADIQAMNKAFEPGMPTVMIHGHFDSFDFKLIDEAEAHRIAIDDARKAGHA